MYWLSWWKEGKEYAFSYSCFDTALEYANEYAEPGFRIECGGIIVYEDEA